MNAWRAGGEGFLDVKLAARSDRRAGIDTPFFFSISVQVMVLDGGDGRSGTNAWCLRYFCFSNSFKSAPSRGGLVFYQRCGEVPKKSSAMVEFMVDVSEGFAC